MALRVGILGVIAIVVFCALFFRLWALQVISGERYLENANNNQIRSFGVIAPRGSIVDRDGDVLVSNMPGTLVQIWPAALENVPIVERDKMLRRISMLLGLKAKNVREKVEERLQSDPLTPVTIDTGVGELRTAYLMEHQGEFPGVPVPPDPHRTRSALLVPAQLRAGEPGRADPGPRRGDQQRPAEGQGRTGLRRR